MRRLLQEMKIFQLRAKLLREKEEDPLKIQPRKLRLMVKLHKLQHLHNHLELLSEAR